MSIPPKEQQYCLFDLGINVSELRRNEEMIMATAKSASTMVTYESRWRAFQDWCRRAGRQAMPATDETLRLYITWALKVYGNRLETVKVAMTAVGFYHRSEELPSPINKQIRAFLGQCARHLQEEPMGRDPITPEDLRRACSALGNTPLEIRDRAILLVGFACGWRGDELASLRLSGIRFADEGVILRIGKSKTDQEGRGRVIGIQFGCRAATCPVRALKKWIEVRGHKNGPLFLRFNSPTYMYDEGITRKAINLVVQRSLNRAGIKTKLKRYGSHSLRAGLITTAISRGASELSVMDRTGQKSIATIQKYVRPARAFRFNPLKGVL